MVYVTSTAVGIKPERIIHASNGSMAGTKSEPDNFDVISVCIKEK